MGRAVPAAGVMPARAQCLLYALGGGLGHLTRAVALARAALARGHAPTLLLNSPFASRVPYRDEIAGAEIIELSPALDRDQVAVRVRALLARRAWDAVVVDTFPRGLGGELAALLPATAGVKILVHRLLCPEYVAWADLHRFAEHYDRILVPGEPAPLDRHPRALVTPPWLLCDPGELLDRPAARRRLGVPEHRDLVLVTGTGRDEEIREAAALAARLARRLGPRAAVRFSAPGAAEARWPLLPLLPGVDVLVGQGGYNTVHEARATGTPLVALARARRYDRQAERLHASERVATAPEIEARAAALLGRRGPRPAPAYENGVHRALDDIERLMDRSGAPAPRPRSRW